MNSDELSALFFRLEEAGACNIDLISPTPYIKELLPTLREAKRLGLSIPIVYNSGGYEKTETLKMLSGSIDIYLPDFKFFSSSLSSRYASAPDYAARCLDAIKEMYAQVGPPLWDGEQLKSGVIVRHLILPGNSRDSVEVLRLLKQHFPRDGIVLSLLRQYTPMHLSKDFPEIARPITSLEYKRVLNAAEEYGFSYIYTQSKESVGEGFVPDFSVFFNENN